MHRPKAPFHSSFDCATGEFFAWSSRGLYIVTTHPFHVRHYGAVDGHSVPWASFVKGGIGQLRAFVEEVAEYKMSRDPFSQKALICHWTPDTDEDLRLWNTAASVEAFFEAVGVDRIKRVGHFEAAPALHLFMLWLIDQVPEIERLLRQCPQILFLGWRSAPRHLMLVRP